MVLPFVIAPVVALIVAGFVNEAVTLSRLVKPALMSASTLPFRRITTVPGAGTAEKFCPNAPYVLRPPAAALPDGVFAMPQALLLLL
jgi:hypothetical protein